MCKSDDMFGYKIIKKARELVEIYQSRSKGVDVLAVKTINITTVTRVFITSNQELQIK